MTGSVVSEEDGLPLPGVNVLVKNTLTGAVTNFDGAYTIKVPEDGVLIFSSLGYTTIETPVDSRSVIDIVMIADAQLLDEVVLTGYSTQKKKDIIGSVAVVDVDNMKSIPAGSAAQALQGQVSGVNVVNNGLPGAAPSINIRGVSSFGDSQPLVLIDGVQGNLNDISSSDIESMQVLKDAGAAAIYGVRGSNGVIVVTTKKGKAGSGPTFSLDSYYGMQMPLSGNPFDLIIDPEEFARLALIADPDNSLFNTGIKDFMYTSPNGAGIANAGDPVVDPSLYNPENYLIQKTNKSGTNWFQEAFDPAPMTEHNLNVSGATDKVNYMFSLGYLDQEGTYVGTYLKRYSLRVNTEYKLSDNVRIGQHLNIYFKDSQGGTTNGQFGGISELYKMMPIIPTHDIVGNYGGTRAGINLGSNSNPIASQERRANNINESKNLIADVYAEVDFLKNFTIRTSLGGFFTDTYNTTFRITPQENIQGFLSPNGFSESSAFQRRTMWTNTLNYNGQFGKHHINTVLGTEAIKNLGRSVGGSREAYFILDPNYVTLSNGTQNVTFYSNAFEDTLISLFGRLDYSFNDKYLLGLTVRRDGSSRFGKESRYGTFPSASIGWRLSNEGFMKKINWLNDLKLRASYGVLGSQNNIDPMNQYDLFGGSLSNAYYDITGSLNTAQQGFFQIQNGNTKTGWERNKITNTGFDVTLFNYRLDVSMEYYKKNIDGLLFAPTLPGTAGGATPGTINIGDIQNSGLDFSTTYRGNINEALGFSISANITSYNNLVKRIPDPGYFDTGFHQQLGNMVRNMEGEAVSSFFGYDVIDLFDSDEDVNSSPTQSGAAPGRFKYRDVNGDNVINIDDRTIIGDPNPDFTYGITFGLNYKGFDFSTMLFGSQGNDAINTVRTYTDFFSTYVGAKGNRLLNAWSPQNMDTNIPRIETANSFSTAGVMNSYFVEDASFLRMRSLILGYSFNPDIIDQLGLNKFRVYVQGSNLFTITNYSGLNPELTGSSSSFGIDYSTYPTNQPTLALGLNLTF
ncbi:MAG: TonB-dependent receptor [Flavobacteriaceae bacterium]